MGEVGERAAFGRRVVRALEEGGVGGPIEFDAEQFAVRVGGSQVVWLWTIWRGVRGLSEGEEGEVLREWVGRGWGGGWVLGLEEALVGLWPRVRERVYYGLLRLQAEAEGWEPSTFEVRSLSGCGGLVAGLVYGVEGGWVEVGRGVLEGWGVGLDALFGIATDQVAARSECGLVELGSGVWGSSFGDGQDAARLLTPRVLERVPVCGERVVFAPTPECVLVAGSEDRRGLRVMTELAERLWVRDRPLSLRAWVWRGGVWEEFRTGGGVGRRLRRLALRQEAQVYSEQKVLLERLLRRRGERVRVAEFTAGERGEGGVSCCVWCEGEEVLLPRTEWVCFVRGGESVCVARWERVEEEVGWEVVEWSPVRVRAKRWPSERALARLDESRRAA